MKVIKPLFLDGLWKEFEASKFDKKKLKTLHQKITKLRFLDPACGCGNFLIIAYRELRLLELEIVKVELKGQQVTNVNEYFLVDVDQFYGIEYEEFPSQITQVAMWLMDHQMNGLASLSFGKYFKRIPLVKSATIKHGNALQVDWQSMIDPLPWEKGVQKFDFIFGNPPFVGYAWQNEEQKKDMDLIFSGVKGSGVMDYVSAWYIKAAQYLELYNKVGFHVICAFVSTNSISQGEQVGMLWNELFNKYKIKIQFAHRTFKWSNEAKGNAGVHVVIIGFSNFDNNNKRLYEYENIKGEPHETRVNNINPYLVEGKDNFISKRSSPISNVPNISRGSDAIDDGNLLLNLEEKNSLVAKYSGIENLIHPFLMGREFLNNIPRFCLWLKNVSPSEIKKYPDVYDRVEKVRIFRLSSKRKQTLKAAKFPSLFGEERQPNSSYLAIPKVSSENRLYIPIGFCDANTICGDKLFNLPNATLYHFGVITSLMHNTWMRNTCGRLESRYSYSNTILYNNFPWAETPNDKQKQNVEEAAQKVLDARAQFPDASLAYLYDPNTMPPVLVKAHQALDKAVDLCYRPQSFVNETKRIEFLFEMYDKLTSGMFGKVKKTIKKTL